MIHARILAGPAPDVMARVLGDPLDHPGVELVVALLLELEGAGDGAADRHRVLLDHQVVLPGGVVGELDPRADGVEVNQVREDDALAEPDDDENQDDDFDENDDDDDKDNGDDDDDVSEPDDVVMSWQEVKTLVVDLAAVHGEASHHDPRVPVLHADVDHLPRPSHVRVPSFHDVGRVDHHLMMMMVMMMMIWM